MAETVVLEGKKRRTMAIPVFLAVGFSAALVRGYLGANTTTGRVVLLGTIGTLLVIDVAYCVWLARQPRERLEIRPDRITLWFGPDRGVGLGTTPPVVVRRQTIGVGTHASTRWILTDGTGTAHRFAGDESTPLEAAVALIDLTPFHPDEVFEAVQRAGWPAEKRT